MLSSFEIKIGNVYCPVYILELLTSVRGMYGSPVVEPLVVFGSFEVVLPMVVGEIQDVEEGKPDEAVEKEMPVEPA